MSHTIFLSFNLHTDIYWFRLECIVAGVRATSHVSAAHSVTTCCYRKLSSSSLPLSTQCSVNLAQRSRCKELDWEISLSPKQIIYSATATQTAPPKTMPKAVTAVSPIPLRMCNGAYQKSLLHGPPQQRPRIPFGSHRLLARERSQTRNSGSLRWIGDRVCYYF